MPRKATLTIPSAVTSKGDILRLIRELDDFDEFARQASLRGTKVVPATRTSAVLREFSDLYETTLVTPQGRKTLQKALKALAEQAPQIHVSFAVAPSYDVLEGTVAWLRKNVRPDVLIQVGLQPSIVGGCVVRTANKVFDFGLGQYMNSHYETLRKEVAAL